MGKYSRLGKNTILVLIGNAGAKLIGLVMLPFYTRWLSVADYGLTDILSVYVTLLIGIVSCSIGESLFIFPKGADEKDKREYFSTGILFLIGMMSLTAVIFETCDIVGKDFGISNSFYDNIWLIYGMIACMLFQQTIQQFTRSLDKMIVYSITGIVVTICTALFSFVFIPNYGVYGYVYSMNLAFLSGAIYSFFASGSFRYIQLGFFSKTKCREMLKYSMPLIPNGIMWWLVGALNRPIMESHVGLDGIGLFAVANKFPGILTMLFGLFTTSWQISVIEEYGKEGFKTFYNRVVRIIIVGVVVLFYAISLFSGILVTILTTPAFYDASRYIPFLTLGAVLFSMSSLCGALFSAVRQSKYTFYSSIWGGMTAVVCNFILIPSYGVMGASIAIILSYLALAISRFAYSWQFVQLRNIKKYVLMGLLALTTVVVVYNISSEWYVVPFILLMMVLSLFVNIDLLKEFQVLIYKIKSRHG